MTTLTDTAAIAAIGAASRELRLPTVRAEAEHLAEVALRSRVGHLPYLAERLLGRQVDDRAERRRQRRVHEDALSPPEAPRRLRRVGLTDGERGDGRRPRFRCLPRQGRARRSVRHYSGPARATC